MKKILMNFSENILSRSQMKAIRGGMNMALHVRDVQITKIIYALFKYMEGVNVMWEVLEEDV